MDTNEKIVCSWLSMNHFFILTNLDYAQFHSDIDILAINVKTKSVLDFEIKIRTGSTYISNNRNKQNGFYHICNQLLGHDRNNKINEVVGINHGYKVRKVLVTTKSFLGKTNKTREKWIRQFKSNNINVVFIEKVVDILLKKSKFLKITKDEIIQILRLQHKI